MSATTYNAGVATRKAVNTGGRKTAEGAKAVLRGVTDFFRGVVAAEPSAPTKKVIARKTAARKTAARKTAARKTAARKTAARKTAARKPAAKPAVAKK